MNWRYCNPNRNIENKEDMKGMGVKGIGDERGVDTLPSLPPLLSQGRICHTDRWDTPG